MRDLALIRIRNQNLLTFKALYTHIHLVLFSLFLICANFLRLFPLYPFPSHLSPLEFSLYLFSAPIYFSKVRKSFVLLFLITLFFLYGILLNGFELVGLLYHLKLMGMIIAGVAIGEGFFKLYPDEKKGLERFLRPFFLSALLGLALFLFFPKANTLFQLLGTYGIQFHGDPHERRFISTLFDPNYYAAIACIPLLLALYLKKWPLALFFWGTILLTFSRSGIATALFTLLIFRPPLKQLLLFALPLLPVLLFAADPLLHLLSRTRYLFEDPSALARFEGFELALSTLFERPLFGSGFVRLSGIDSSLLTTLITFGFIPTLLFALYLLFSLQQSGPSRLQKGLYTYLTACILFTSQFNQLLYYQYFLIPMIALLTYLQRRPLAHSSRT